MTQPCKEGSLEGTSLLQRLREVRCNIHTAMLLFNSAARAHGLDVPGLVASSKAALPATVPQGNGSVMHQLASIGDRASPTLFVCLMARERHDCIMPSKEWCHATWLMPSLQTSEASLNGTHTRACTHAYVHANAIRQRAPSGGPHLGGASASQMPTWSQPDTEGPSLRTLPQNAAPVRQTCLHVGACAKHAGGGICEGKGALQHLCRTWGQLFVLVHTARPSQPMTPGRACKRGLADNTICCT